MNESKDGTFKLTDSEKSRIEEVRRKDLVEPGTVSFNLLKTIDSLRVQKRQAERYIHLNMSAIYENYKLMTKAKVKLDDKTLMTEEDTLFAVKADYRKYHTSILTLIDNILMNYSELLTVVGHKDVVGGVIIDNTTFEVMLDETNQEIKEMGYTLLE